MLKEKVGKKKLTTQPMNYCATWQLVSLDLELHTVKKLPLFSFFSNRTEIQPD